MPSIFFTHFYLLIPLNLSHFPPLICCWHIWYGLGTVGVVTTGGGEIGGCQETLHINYNLMPRIFHFTAYLFIYGHKACGILVPWPGIKPRPPALKVLNLNHWTIREGPSSYFFFFKYIYIMLSPFSFFLKNFFSLFSCDYAGSSFCAGFSLVVESGGFSL